MAERRRPVECVFCCCERRFRVTRSRGKTLDSGGFGTTATFQAFGDSKVRDANKNGDGSENAINFSSDDDGGGDEQDAESEVAKSPLDDNEETAMNKNPSPARYLFLEEVIYLHERGMLHAYLSLEEEKEEDDNDGADRDKKKPLELRDLYELLPVCHLPLATYLVYQHVRAQTYRVVRHTAGRRALLQAMEERLLSLQRHQQQKQQDGDANDAINEKESSSLLPDSWCLQEPCSKKHRTFSSDNGEEAIEGQNDEATDEPNDETFSSNRETAAKESKSTTINTTKKRRWGRGDSQFEILRQQLRVDAARAPPPQPGVGLAFDCYNPNTHFSSSCPGLPDFCVAITYFSSSSSSSSSSSTTSCDKGSSHGHQRQSFSFADLQKLLASAASAESAALPSLALGGPPADGSTTKERAPVPLKIATVSDSGTVIMFGVSDFPVPIMESPTES